MRIAFVVDPLRSLKAYKDTSIALMRAAQAAGHAVWAVRQEAIHWSAQHGVCAEALHLEMLADDDDWFVEVDRHVVALRDFGDEEIVRGELNWGPWCPIGAGMSRWDGP